MDANAQLHGDFANLPDFQGGNCAPQRLNRGPFIFLLWVTLVVSGCNRFAPPNDTVPGSVPVFESATFSNPSTIDNPYFPQPVGVIRRYEGDGEVILIDVLNDEKEVMGIAVRGVVNSDGTILVGTGFTVSNPSSGHYSITFNTPFAGPPTVTATAEHQGADTEKVVMTDGVTSANAMLATRSIIFDGGFVNMTFHFIAVGPR